MENDSINKEQPKKKGYFGKKLLIIAMILSFIISMVTGILKFRELLRPFNIPYDKLPMQQISVWHDWSGVVLILLILIHLIMQGSWFRSIFRRNTNPNSKKIFFIGAILIVVIALFSFTIVLIRIHASSIKPSTVTSLPSVEITQYQGENLSSISDFVENSIKGPQYIDIKNYSLGITGMVNNSLNLTYDQVLDHTKYSKVVTLNCVEGWSVKILWEGVLLKDLLNQAGIKNGANTVIFYAYDGYSSSLPLDYIINNNIILADKMNGVVIPPERGYPFMVVAENKWGYKWVKWVTKIEVSNDPSYKGYWESAGYNQNGDLNGPIFEK